MVFPHSLVADTLKEALPGLSSPFSVSINPLKTECADLFIRLRFIQQQCQQLRLRSIEYYGDRCIMNWEGSGRRWSWPDLRYYPSICLEPAFTLVSCSAYSSTLKMEAICSPKTSFDFQQATQRYIPEYSTLQIFFFDQGFPFYVDHPGINPLHLIG
jgi:hypothetical protein